MKTLPMIHLGIGHVGKTLVDQIINQHNYIRKTFDINLSYRGLFTSKHGWVNAKGFSLSALKKLTHGQTFLEKRKPLHYINSCPSPFVLIDTTASNETYPLLLTALKKGGFVVLSNKKPLTGSQKEFDKLHDIGSGKLLYETTVGAGLPVIGTLKSLLDTGDEIIRLQGSFSGTLGFIFSEIEKGAAFSEVVQKAMKKGYTEPDPRDDLSGLDVARKGLILSRIIGRKIELSNIRVQSLYPSSVARISVDTFLSTMEKLNKTYKQKFDRAKRLGKTLRYIATIMPLSCRAGFELVDKQSDFGMLSGPDNLIVMQTKRYDKNPLVIKGPGAGVDVTAAGVFADILAIAKIMNGVKI